VFPVNGPENWQDACLAAQDDGWWWELHNGKEWVIQGGTLTFQFGPEYYRIARGPAPEGKDLGMKARERTALLNALDLLLDEYDDRAAQFGDDYLWRKHEDTDAIATARHVRDLLISRKAYDRRTRKERARARERRRETPETHDDRG
jgi:hypothetical protein